MNAELYLRTNHCLKKACFLDTLATRSLLKFWVSFLIIFFKWIVSVFLVAAWLTYSILETTRVTLKCLLLPVLETFGNHLLLSVFILLLFFAGNIFCIFIVNDLAYSLILNGSHIHICVSSCLFWKRHVLNCSLLNQIKMTVVLCHCKKKKTTTTETLAFVEGSSLWMYCSDTE